MAALASSASVMRLIPRLRKLLSLGYTVDENQDLAFLLDGLAHPAVENVCKGWILSQRLLAARPGIANDGEAVCALLALLPEVRQAWLAIAAARCKEAGQMQDGALLLNLVSQLQGAAGWVEAALPCAQLAVSSCAQLERELLGVSLEQTAAAPALMRVLAVAHALSKYQGDSLPVLPGVDAYGVEAQQNWSRGRLLALPYAANGIGTPAKDYVLRGDWDVASANEQPLIGWVLAYPWPLLLAMVAYAQYNWAAENRGGLLLELSPGQNPFRPTEIKVLVLGPEGDETLCGSLSDLLLKSLDMLGVACFPHTPSAAELNAQLGSLVGSLLSRHVWRYQDGASGQHGQYQIHPLFADACYRLPGSKVFNRTGRQLWQSVRISAEAMCNERRSQLTGVQREGENQ
jgi:hypothetical protein